MVALQQMDTRRFGDGTDAENTIHESRKRISARGILLEFEWPSSAPILAFVRGPGTLRPPPIGPAPRRLEEVQPGGRRGWKRRHLARDLYGQPGSIRKC